MQKVCVFGFLQALICPAGCPPAVNNKNGQYPVALKMRQGGSGAERGNTFAGLRKVAVKASEIGKRIG